MRELLLSAVYFQHIKFVNLADWLDLTTNKISLNGDVCTLICMPFVEMQPSFCLSCEKIMNLFFVPWNRRALRNFDREGGANNNQVSISKTPCL